MKTILAKTLGGLNPQYYFRQFFFGMLFAILLFLTRSSAEEGVHSVTDNALLYGHLIVSTLLYPYARFVYESVVGFIMGDNFIIANAILFMFVKLFTMGLCWSLSVFIAPIGFIYLYIYHSRAQDQ